MTTKNRVVLGRGLEALLPTPPEAEETSAPTIAAVTDESLPRTLPIDHVTPNPDQPRTVFNPEALAELASSLRERGMMQPIVVTAVGDRYQIVAGERRWRAAREAGWTDVPVVVMVTDDPETRLELALIENIHREDLSPIELAQAYRRLIDAFNYTQADLASKLGKSRSAIANSLRLLNLPESIQAWVASGELTEGHARTLLSVASPSEQQQMAEAMRAGGMTVRQAENVTRRRKPGRPAKRRPSPELQAVETELKQLLGTAVKIAPHPKRGKIEIEFYGHDDLDRLLDLLRRVRS